MNFVNYLPKYKWTIVTYPWYDVWNRHRESKNTKLTKLVQVRNFLLPFWVKGNLTWGERETPSFYADFSICPKPHVSPESQPSSYEARTQLSAFSQIPKSSAHTFGTWRHSHLLVSISIWDFYFDICEWHILSAQAWTPALMLHLTNPCTKQKVLSLTKPKGKIYKTKSLGNYITQWVKNYFSSKLSH